MSRVGPVSADCLLAAVILLVMIGAPGCRREPPAASPDASGSITGAAWFEPSGAERGLAFDHRSGAQGRFMIPEIMTGGAALVDIDGDGDLDAYLVQAGGLEAGGSPGSGNRLFVNDGAGRFRDVTDGSGAGDGGYGMGVACGDYDNDGLTDLYVTNVGPNTLLRNAGGGRFADATATAGVGHPGWGSSAAFVDYDADGDLDLYVCNYLEWSIETERSCFNPMGDGRDYCSPQQYDAPAADVLFRNEGDGTFTDVTAAAGVDAFAGTGLGVVCADFDGDHRTDIFVANDGMRDLLWVQQEDGSFRDAGVEMGCAFDLEGRAAAGMGVAAADVDHDGDPDLMVCNLRSESDTLLRNEGGYFVNVTVIAGLGAGSRPFTRFGTTFADFDNDGTMDVYQANGRVARHPEPFDAERVYAEPNLLWRGTGPMQFEEVRPRGGTTMPLIGTSRGAAFGDVDNDGGIDALVVEIDDRARLLRNVVPNRGHWISFRILDEHGRDALGATVTITEGDATFVSDVRAASSYQASNDPRVHFGLGGKTSIDEVTVRWVDGTTDRFGPFDVDQVATLRRPSAPD